MNNIIELVDIRNKECKLLDMIDIKFIVDKLSNDFDIEITKIINKNDKYIMSLSLTTLELTVDYEKLKEKKDIVYTNYLIVFALVHELRHFLQLNGDSGILSFIYQECFQYLNSKALFKIAFYSRFHDYFPIEVNANIVGLLYVMYIQRILNDQEYYEIFKTMLFNVLDKVGTEENNDVLVSLLGDDYLKGVEDLDEYELFMNGLLREKDKRDKMLKMILL